MVRHTFSSGELYGPNRRSLRSDKTSCTSGTQMNTETLSWKNSLPTARRASLPPFSNGHHLRSSKVLEKTAKPMGQNDSLEVQCNGINSSHSYGTRFCAKNAELIHQKLSPTRKNNLWDGPLGIKHKRSRTTSSSFPNVPEGDQLSPTVSDLGHKLRSRHVWLPNNIITITPDEEDSSHHSCMKQFETFSLAGDIEDYTEDCESVLTVNNLNSEEEEEEERGCKSSDLKHRQNQIVKRKRLTAEEKLIEDNKAYYKLEVKNNKLRSSGYYLHQRDISTSIVNKESGFAEIDVSKETAITLNGEQTEKFCGDDSLREKLNCSVEVKRNKIRLSELSLLNNEAENFMFGEPTKSAENSSSDDGDYGDSKNIENRSFCVNDAIADDSKNNNAMETDKCGSSVNESKVESQEKYQTELNCKETSQDIDHKYDSYSQYVMYRESCIDGEPFYQQKDEKDFHNNEFETNSLPFCSSFEVNSVENLQRRQRRRGCVESQTHDNIDSYKCELPGLPGCNKNNVYPHTSLKMQNKLESENRNEGIAKMTNEHNACRSENANESFPLSNCHSHEIQTSCSSKVGDCDENKDIRMQSSSRPREIKNEAVTGLHFSFEGVPESEPWYQTYQRQDEGEEFYLSTVNDCTYWKSFLLPYEMPPEQFSTLSSGMGVPKTAKVSSIKRHKRKRKSNLLDKKPRKSPRCHASTLAILSSLMHHKKIKETESTSDDNLTRIAEEDTNDSSTAMKTNDSVQQKGIKELAQNIDQLLGLYTEIGLSSESHTVLTNNSNDVPEEVNYGKNHKYKTLKYKRPHKTVNAGNVKKSETGVSVKDAEVSDVDPLVLEELAVSGENPFSSVDDTSIRSRGGPYMDVISLLNSYGTCCCVEGLMKCKDISRYDSDLQPSLKETCNSSECASSTGETVRHSGVIRVRGKKRKKKKNLTGWPVEKQKLKRRLLLKLARPELQIKVLEAKSKEKKLSVNETGISNTELDKNTCVPRIEVKECKEGTSKQSENSGTEGSMGGSSSINEVCTGNVSRKIANSGYVDSVDTSTEEIRTSYNEYTSHTDMSIATSPARTAEKLCMARNPSVDSNSQHCDFQPRVRVKKINSVDDINFVLKSSSNASSVNNTRQLRSASFSSSATLRKNSCHFDSVDTMEVVRRASGRMKKSCSRWDSWSTRRRR